MAVYEQPFSLVHCPNTAMFVCLLKFINNTRERLVVDDNYICGVTDDCN